MKTSLLALLVLVAPAIARDGVDTQYAKGLFQRLETDKFDYWKGFGEQPPGGYVFRYEIDVTGDGQNEVMVASSLDADHRGAGWTVFTRSQSGWLSTGQIRLNPSAMFGKTSSDTRCLTLGGWQRMSGSEYSITQYQFKSDATFADQSRTVSILTEDERHELGQESWGERQGLGRIIAPTVSMMLFAEYLTDPASQWRAYDPKLPANAQHQQDQERIRMDAASGFTPEHAAKLVAGLEPSTDAKNGDVSRQRTIIPPLAPSKKSKLTQAPHPAPNMEPTSSTPWSVIAVLIVAAIGLLWLLVEKRK